MPEYLTPGVYVEETSFRSKSIEGVPTSTFGMAGLARYGPLPYVLPDGISVPVMPTLVTSYAEFERAFGDLSSPSDDGKANYLAHSARAFFANGGQRLYVARVFPWARDGQGNVDVSRVDAAFARRAVTAPGGPGAPVAMPTWRARWRPRLVHLTPAMFTTRPCCSTSAAPRMRMKPPRCSAATRSRSSGLQCTPILVTLAMWSGCTCHAWRRPRAS